MEYKIYAIASDGEIVEYASFENDGYEAQIADKIARREAENRCDNVDFVMRNVFEKKRGVSKKFFKTAMRALRHFDEVGLSNDIYAVLEEIADDGSYEAVFFGDENSPKEDLIDLTNYEI